MIEMVVLSVVLYGIGAIIGFIVGLVFIRRFYRSLENPEFPHQLTMAAILLVWYMLLWPIAIIVQVILWMIVYKNRSADNAD